jgi:hypothetical protein
MLTMKMKSKGYKKGGKMKKYQAGTMVSPDERAIERGNAAMDRISEEGTTNMMESSTPTRPKAKPAQPGSKRPPKRPNAMDGRRKGDIKTEELLGGKTKAEINAAIDSGKNPKKKPPLKATVTPSKATGALARAAKSGLLGVPGAVSNAGVAAGKAAKSILKPTRDGEAMTTKSLLQPRADGTGLTTKPEKMKAGGMMKKKGYAAGGMMKKGYKKGGKVRGAGIARKGVRPAKMR